MQRTYTSRIFKLSGPGYRFTFFDEKGDPVASLWNLSRDVVRAWADAMPLPDATSSHHSK